MHDCASSGHVAGWPLTLNCVVRWSQLWHALQVSGHMTLIPQPYVSCEQNGSKSEQLAGPPPMLYPVTV